MPDWTLRLRQDRADLAHVLIHLCDQLLSRVEFPIIANEVDELDLDLATVEVACEIEQKNLEHGHPIVKRRARSEISSRVMRHSIKMRAHRVYAVPERGSSRHRHIGGRKAEIGAALGTADHLARNAPAFAQHVFSTFDIALRQMQAHGR